MTTADVSTRLVAVGEREYDRRLSFEEVAEHQLPPDVITRGKPTPYTMRVTFAHMGPVRLELVQVVEGDCLYTEFLQEHGEGVHHLGFEVADFRVQLRGICRRCRQHHRREESP